MDHIKIPENISGHPEWDFEKSINSVDFSKWLSKNMSVGFFFSIFYVLAVFGGQKYMEDKPRFNLRRSMMLWSLFLAVFSAIGTVRCVYVMSFLYINDGVMGIVCGKLFYLGPIARFWGPVFVSSKILEYMDTAFIILRKQKLIFLHWYHHLTVALFSWWVYGAQFAGGGVFMTVNFFVHTLMYSYYAIRAAGYRLPRPIAVFITASQIIQMVVGSWTMYTIYNWRNVEACTTSYEHLFYGSFMYVSYFVLFVNFFYNTYLAKKPKPASKNEGEKPTDKAAPVLSHNNNDDKIRRRVVAASA